MKKETNEATSKAQPHTFIGLRDVLFDEINLLRANKVSVSRARAVSQLARRIIESATLDLFAQGQIGQGDPKNLKRLMNTNV